MLGGASTGTPPKTPSKFVLQSLHDNPLVRQDYVSDELLDTHYTLLAFV